MKNEEIKMEKKISLKAIEKTVSVEGNLDSLAYLEIINLFPHAHIIKYFVILQQ